MSGDTKQALRKWMNKRQTARLGGVRAVRAIAKAGKPKTLAKRRTSADSAAAHRR